MLTVVKRLIAGKDDTGALQQQITALKAEGADASAEIDRLKRERVAAASYEEARELDERIARQIWVTEHCAAALPQLELQLDAARALEQAAALARHKVVLLEIYPKLKTAVLAAVETQHEAIAAREAACRELGEAVVSRNLPIIAYAGFLMKDLVAIWQAENDRLFAELARKPRITSPRLMPMRNSMRLSATMPALRSGIACWTSTAQRIASTTLANSTSMPSPVVLTMRP
jgi:hypothetical protein